MKTIKHLAVRATAFLCLFALLFVPAVSAQLSLADADQDAFQQAVQTLSQDDSDVLSDIHAEVDEARKNAPVMSQLDWQNYGEHLHNALSESHTGIRHSALRLIIAYSENLDLGNDAVVDLMRIYRDDDSEQARRMAVVALAELNSELAVDYLERAHEFEKSETVKRTIAAVVTKHRTDQKAS